MLDPLTGEIDPENSAFTVGKVKVEVRLHKKSAGRWVKLVGESSTFSFRLPTHANPYRTDGDSPLATPFSASSAPVSNTKSKQKNWAGIAEDAMKAETEATADDDPNAGGDNTVNSFFQKIFADADDDTKKAMMKSYQESGGTTLSTSWADVGKKTVEVKPPEGSEWRKWG